MQPVVNISDLLLKRKQITHYTQTYSKQDYYFIEEVLSSTSVMRTVKYEMKKQPPRCYVRKDVLRNFAKFTGKCLYQTLFFNEVAIMRSAILLK